MLPIAVLPIAGLLLRLGQPDLLDIAVRRGGGRRDLRQSRPAVRARHRRRPRAGQQRRGGLGRAGLLPGRDARRRDLAAPSRPTRSRGSPRTRPRSPSDAWRDQGDRQAVGADRHRLRADRGRRSTIASSTIKLPDYLAFFGGRRFVPIVCGPRRAGRSPRSSASAIAPIDAGIDGLSTARDRLGRRSGCSSTACSTGC